MINLTRYAALSFDVYGTLIDWEAGISAVLVEWAKRRGSELGDEALLLAYADNEAAVEREYPGLAYCDDRFLQTGCTQFHGAPRGSWCAWGGEAAAAPRSAIALP